MDEEVPVLSGRTLLSPPCRGLDGPFSLYQGFPLAFSAKHALADD